MANSLSPTVDASPQFARQFDIETIGGDQRQRLAEMLRSNALNIPQGQMVSGWYVAPSWTQNLAQTLNTAVGVMGGRMLDEERAQKTAEALKKFQGVEEEIPLNKAIQSNASQAEGQTPFAGQQTLSQRFAGNAQPSAEQTPMNPEMAPRQTRMRPLTQDEQDMALLNLASVNPQIANVYGGLLGARATRAQKLEDALILQRQRAEDQQNLARLHGAIAAGSRQPGAPVAVIGPNGQPMYVAPNQAYGMIPATEAKPLTEAQSKASVFQSQMVGASNQLNKLQTNGDYDPTSKKSQFETGMAGGITNIAASEAAQQAKQAQDQWAEAYLRFKTGAAATAGEVEQNRRTFFPVFGDSEKTIRQKAEARRQAENDIGIAAGRGNYSGVQPQSSAAPTANYGAPPAGAVREKK